MSNLEVFLWIMTVIALTGTYLNVKQQRIGFAFWMISDERTKGSKLWSSRRGY